MAEREDPEPHQARVQQHAAAPSDPGLHHPLRAVGPEALLQDFVIDRSDLGDSFSCLVAGDTGEGDHSQYAVVPGLNKVEWKLKSDKNYEAEFKLKDVAVAAKFDDKGRWLETETAIEQSALPKEVLKVLLDGKGAVVSKSTERKKGP